MNKLLKFGMIFLIGIFLISFSSAYLRSTPSYTQYGGVGGLGSFAGSDSLKFDAEMCETGQDFLIQIVPFGCEPAVVRSDLLEENDAPVFCKLGATQINPLIEVEAIDSMVLTGETSSDVRSISYFPAKAALGFAGSIETGEINSPVLDNLGYVNILLKQNPNESSMPDFVEGNLTARIRYDIENAFGVGSASFYLPVLNDDDWKDKFVQYSFWEGRGYLRADSVTEDRAAISIYSDESVATSGLASRKGREYNKLKYSTINLQKGETSNSLYLPGFSSCLASLKLRLDNIVNPDTRVKLKVNSDYVEVSEGEWFAENKCQIRSIDKKGLFQSVRIYCKEDDAKSETFELRIAPRVELNIDGEIKEYEVGDWLYKTEDGEKSVYLGYVGTKKESESLEDLYVVLVSLPVHKDKLDEDEIDSVVTHAEFAYSSTDTGAKVFDKTSDLLKGLSAKSIQGFKYLVKGEDFDFIQYKDVAISAPEEVNGKKVSIAGFADAEDDVLISVIEEEYDLKTEDENFLIVDGDEKTGLILEKGNFGKPKFILKPDETLSTVIFGKFWAKETECEAYTGCSEFVLSTDTDFSPVSGYSGFFGNLVGANLSTDLKKLTVRRILFETEGEGEKYKEYYEDARSDFETVINSFSGEKEKSNSLTTYGEDALYQEILLAESLGQKKTMLDLCADFEASYPNAQKSLDMCYDDYRISNLEISSKEILVNGDVKKIVFDEVYEPAFEDFGVVLYVQGPNGNTKQYNLKKDTPIYLTGFREEGEVYFILGSSVFLDYDGEWKWSLDKKVWDSVSVTSVSSGTRKGQTASKNAQNIFKLIDGKNYNDGKQILYNNNIFENSYDSLNEFVELEDIVDEDSANVKMYIYGDSFVESTLKSDTKRLEVDDIFGYNGYSFTIKKINLRQSAKVSIIPSVNYQYTDAEFSFKVGIEKRSFPLSPEKAEEKIEGLNQSIRDWENAYNALNKVTTYMKAACLLTGTGLTVKNFLANAGGKAIARQKVMQGDYGWTKICEEAISKGKYGGSMDKCFLDNADAIDAEVEIYNSILEKQNERIKQIEALPEITDKNPLGDDVVNTEKFVEKYSPEVTENLKEVIGDKDGKFRDINLDDMETLLGSDGYNKNYDLEELREIEFYKNVLNSNADAETKTKAENKLYSLLSDVKANSNNFIVRKGIVDKYGVNEIHFGFDKNAEEIKFGEDLTFGKIKDKFSNSGVIDDNALVQIYVKNNVEHIVLLSSENIVQQTYVVENGALQIKNSENDNPLNLKFVKYDKSSYENEYKASAGETRPVIRYFETEPYKGNPAVVPFDLKNGWYAATKQTLGVGKNIAAYDDSGVVKSFYLCNVGPNGLEEYIGGDDECQQYNLATGQEYTNFPGLNADETFNLVQKAVSAIESAERAYSRGGTSVRIDGKNIRIGEPAVDVPAVQCQDFMSPKECNLLFNVCDPVICPSSRCDLGGTYPVRDVIQSGIIGSIALCLPNFPEVKVPVCLSGITAGIDGWNSVQKSYRDCLQQNLDTGETVGICDEIHSQYACDFFWRQSLPLVQVAIPKILSFALGQNVRGGGEYLGVQSAWESAGDSLNYFKQYYAENAYRAFKLRSTEDVGGTVCKSFASVVYADSGSLLDSLTEPDSPTQFYGNFEEIQLSTVTNPPISQYKVFYHIYAGKDTGAYYQVKLRNSGSSFYQDTAFERIVASGYAGVGEYATDTKDITAPSGYSELCIIVNGQEECGFKQVTTSLAIDYLQASYLADQASQTGITTSGECISGTSSLYSLINPNLQNGVENVIDPAIYNQGIQRTCATNNPGVGTDASAGTEDSRWQEVGYCDDPNIKCWIDTDSIKDVVEFSWLQEDALEDVQESYIESLAGDYLNKEEGDKAIEEIKGKDVSILEKIELIDNVLGDIFYSYQKATLYFLRGIYYSQLAIEEKNKVDELKIANLAGVGVAGVDEEGFCEFVDSFNEVKEMTDARQRVLKAAELLEGTSASKTLVIEDYDRVAGVNCFDSVLHVYEKSGVLMTGCIYSDEKGKEYSVNGKTIKIGETKNSNGQNIYWIAANPNVCKLNGEKSPSSVSENEKLNGIQPGDILSIVYNENYGHNVIFIEWVNLNNRVAKVFDWNGRDGSGNKIFRYWEVDLSDDAGHSVYMYWSPYISSTTTTPTETEKTKTDVEKQFADYSSPDFEFQDGSIWSRNIHYKFYNNQWYWLNYRDNFWYPVSESLDNKNVALERNENLIISLRNKNYVDGLELILKGISYLDGADLVTDNVQMDNYGVFEVDLPSDDSYFFRYQNKVWEFNPLPSAVSRDSYWFDVSKVSFNKVNKQILFSGEVKVTDVLPSENVQDLVLSLVGKDFYGGAPFVFDLSPKLAIETATNIKTQEFDSWEEGNLKGVDLNKFSDKQLSVLYDASNCIYCERYQDECDYDLCTIIGRKLGSSCEYSTKVETIMDESQDIFIRDELLDYCSASGEFTDRELKSIYEAKECVDCGDGTANRCDEDECLAVGKRIGKNCVHSGLWGCEDETPEIFCNVELSNVEYNYFVSFLNKNGLKISDISCENVRIVNNHFTEFHFLGLGIKDVSELQNFEELYYLDLDNNEISDVSSLSNLEKLELLRLNNNKLSTLGSFHSPDSLLYLHLDNNNFDDLSDVLTGLPLPKKIKILSIQNNCISLTTSEFREHLSSWADSYSYSGNPRDDC